MTALAISARERRTILVVLVAGAFVAGVGFGAMHPLITLLLEQQGLSDTLIGLNATLMNVAILVGGPFVPRIVRALGPFNVLALNVALDVTLTLLYPTVEVYTAWCFFRFLWGLVGVQWWVITESWINLLAQDSNRTRVVGLYTAMLSLGMAVGPFVIAETGIDGYSPWFAILGLLLLGALPVLGVARTIPVVAHDENLRAFALVRRAPLVVVAAIVGGFADFAIMSLLPLYGLAHGLAQTDAATMLSAFTLGNVCLQMPIAWFADKVSRGSALVLCAVVTIACSIALPFAVADFVMLWIVLFLWGGVVFAVYMVTLGMLGAAFGPAELVAANAAFIVLYNVGGVVGPLGTGALMDAWSPEGLPTVVAVAMAIVLGFMVARRAR